MVEVVFAVAFVPGVQTKPQALLLGCHQGSGWGTSFLTRIQSFGNMVRKDALHIYSALASRVNSSMLSYKLPAVLLYAVVGVWASHLHFKLDGSEFLHLTSIICVCM